MARSVLGFVVCVLSAGCGPTPGEPVDEVMTPVLPLEANGWSAGGEAESYDTETIYAYINGHAEVYMAYGMVRCVSRRYLDPESDAEIVVDLFEMASPADAYGVFSHDRAGDEVEVGGGGVYRHGWLSFWRGSWYGSIYSTAEGTDTKKRVLDLGRVVADGIPESGEVPDLVARLPVDGLDQNSICFLRSPQILNAHVSLGGGNPLALDPTAEAVVGAYSWELATLHLIVVRYASEAAAEQVENRMRVGEVESPDGPEMTAGRRGSLIAVVVGTDEEEKGEALLIEAL